MGFPEYTEEVARLRDLDPETSLSNEGLLAVMIGDEQTKFEILKVYRQRFGFPRPIPTSQPELDDGVPRLEIESAAEILIDSEEGMLGRLVVAMARRDQGEARERLASAMAQFAQYVAITSRNEIHQVTWDEVVLDLVVDTRGSSRGG